MHRRIARSFVWLLLALSVGAAALTACLPVKPTIVINSPPSGSQFHEGEDVAVQSTSTDPNAIVRVELLVDGATVRTDPSPTAQGQPSLTLIQTGKATQGTHTISVRAYNAAGMPSDPVAISVTVLQATALGPTATGAPGGPPPVPPTTVPGGGTC